MNNYEYIIAGLPVLSYDWKAASGMDPDEVVGDIRQLLGEKDNALVDILEAGFDESRLSEEFYREALGSRNSFLRQYFAFDLDKRNAKVRFLNKALGRESGQDIFMDDVLPFEGENEIAAALASGDILERERALDDITWKKIDAITTFDYFDIDAVMAFIAKLKIVGRWLALDEETGREMFRKLAAEVKGSYKIN